MAIFTIPQSLKDKFKGATSLVTKAQDVLRVAQNPGAALTKKMGEMTGQGIAQSVGSVGLTVMNPILKAVGQKPIEAKRPEEQGIAQRVSDEVFGGKTVKDIPTRSNEVADWLRSKGVGKKTSYGLAVPAIVGLTALDLTGAGGEKQAAQQGIEAIAKSQAPELITKALKNLGASDDIVKSVLPRLQAINKVEDVAKVLDEVMPGKKFSELIKPVDNLTQEARKYKSAEEFVNRPPMVKQSSSGNIYIKRGDEIIQIPKTVQEDLYRASQEGIVSVDRRLTANKILKKYGLELNPAGKIQNSTSQLTDIYNQATNQAANQVAAQTKQVAQQARQELKPTASATRGTIERQTKDFVDALRNDAEKLTTQPFYNVDKLSISEPGKQLVRRAVDESAQAIGRVTGRPMSADEVLQAAQKTSAVLTKTIGRDETLELGAQAMNLRQQIARMAEEGKVTSEFIEAIKRDKAFATNTARLLQQRSISAIPAEKQAINDILEGILKVNQNTDEILEAAKGVDFNDARQAAEFYRRFVKPKAGEWIDLLRYNAMLSSPVTHIVNAFSNTVNTALVAPIEKTLRGGIDFLASAVTSRPRQYLAGEGAVYAGNYLKNVGNAFRRFADTLSGRRYTTHLDLKQIAPAVKGVRGGIVKTLSVPSRLLEATDQFFSALAEGGEIGALTYRQSKGIKLGDDIKDLAQKDAAYRLFRQETRVQGQGHVLDAIDRITNTVQAWRTSKNPLLSNISKMTVPFLRTPMNIFKQGVEYSPLGFTTVIGATRKTEQITKAIMGTAVFGAIATYMASGRITGAEPINPKQRELWRTAGKQPYSIKVGNRWYSYQKLPPALAYPIMMASSIRDAQDEHKVTDDVSDLIFGAISKYGTFLADQSYAKSFGDLLTTFKGGEESMSRLVSNYWQQFIPYRAMTQWVARMLDESQRKVDTKASFIEKQMQQFMLMYPGLSERVPARMGADGLPIPNRNRFINAFSPIKVSDQIGAFQRFLDESLEIGKIRSSRDAKNEEIRDEAERQWGIIKTIENKEEKKALIKEIMEKSPDVAIKLNDIIKEEKRGLTYIDRQYLTLQVKNGERSQYIYKQIQGMSKDERRKYMADLIEKKIITDDVATQLVELLKAGK